MWVLTSTVKRLRNEATRALYWYGRRFPSQFFSVMRHAWAVNNTYVLECILAATYGVVMAQQYKFEAHSFVQDERAPSLGTRVVLGYVCSRCTLQHHAHLGEAPSCIERP
jgi:hypothetical protein